MNRCRACRSTKLHRFLELGDHPPGNAFLLPEQLGQPEASFPLDALVCLDCALIQIEDRVPADFYRHYLYTPASADGLKQHFEALAEHLATLTSGLVVDVGCNVGLLLDACRTRGLEVAGIDPAENLTVLARERGHRVLGRYFDRAAAAEARATFGPASVVVTTNRFNHIDDLHEFVTAAAELLSDDGLFVVEVPHSGDLVEKNEFDTIYQEHLSEFSVRSFVELYRAVGLELVSVTPLAIHGGSMRVTAQKKGGPRAPEASVARWLEDEVARGLFAAATYDAFRERVERYRTEILALLERLADEGARIAAYGAPAKGNTLLIHYGLGPRLIRFVADRNPRKHGRLTPGTHIPVVPVERILAEQPDFLLLLAWNFADEILAQQAEYLHRGGKFIIPIPEPRIVGADS